MSQVMNITALEIAQRFVGLKEVKGTTANPAILAMLKLDSDWPADDEVPWCSAFVNYIAWLLHLPRSKSLRARSWLDVGVPVLLDRAQPGFDIVVLNRAGGSPDVNERNGPGHVGFFLNASMSVPDGQTYITILGGNQGDMVSIQKYKVDDLLSVQRLLV